jgi:enoyl-CoA hydratase/carnithine racemase
MAQSEGATVRTVTEDGVALVTFENGPLNLLTRSLRSAIVERAAAAATDPAVRVVVLTGEGDRAFSAGSDIRELREALATRGWRSRGEEELAAYETIDRLPKPTVAAIRGYCLGGGLKLALACDLRVCGAESEFGFPEIRLGIFPAGGGTERLPRLIGEARAKELMLLGHRIRAEEAWRLGLLTRVAASGEGLAAALALARDIAAQPALAAQAIVRVVEAGRDRPLAEGAREALETLDAIFASADLAEGLAAFLDKRPPRFTHR